MTADYKKGVATGLAAKPLCVTANIDDFYITGSVRSVEDEFTKVSLGTMAAGYSTSSESPRWLDLAPAALAEVLGSSVEEEDSPYSYAVRVPQFGGNCRFCFACETDKYTSSCYCSPTPVAKAVTSYDNNLGDLACGLMSTYSGTLYLSYLITDYTVAVIFTVGSAYVSALFTKKTNGEVVAINKQQFYSMSAAGNHVKYMFTDVESVGCVRLSRAIDLDGVPFCDIYTIHTCDNDQETDSVNSFYVTGDNSKHFTYIPSDGYFAIRTQ